MALFVLAGLRQSLGTLIDVSRDDAGLLLDIERLPKRVRMRAAVMKRTIDVLLKRTLQQCHAVFTDDWIGCSPRTADALCNIGNVFADCVPHLIRKQIFLDKLLPGSHGTVGYVDDLAPQRACR